jgi:hypothetical protein
MSNINSLINNLPTCKNNLSSPSYNSTNINCPELSSEQLDNFCYNDKKCNVICPKNVNLIKNVIPNKNNSSLIDNIFETFTFDGFIENLNFNPSRLKTSLFILCIVIVIYFFVIRNKKS